MISRKFGDETKRTTTSYTGDTSTVIPPQGGTATTTVLDAQGRTVELKQYTDAARTTSQSTLYSFNKHGRMSEITDPSGAKWTYTYDIRGRRIQIVDPDKGTAKTVYDQGDRATDITSVERNITLHTDYDELGRKTALKKGTTTLTSWEYDTVAKGQISKSTRWVGANAYESAVTSYNSLYKPVGTQLTVPASEGALAGTYKWITSYNLNTGQVMWTQHPAMGGLPSEKVVNTYSPVIGLLSTVGAGTDPLVSAMTYDHYGRNTRMELGAFAQHVWSSSEYDEHTGALARSYTDREVAPQRVEDVRYGYDPSGNITSVATAYGQDAARTTDTQCFSLDPLGRIKEAWTNTGETCAAAPSDSVVGGQDAYWNSYTYDALGNRKTETSHKTASGPAADTVRTYAAPSAGKHDLTKVTQTGTNPHDEVFTYDPAGNTKTRKIGAAVQQVLDWDDEGHLKSVTQGTNVTSYLYDTEGQRLLGKDADGSTLYLPGGNELHLSKAGVLTGTRYYSAGPKVIAVRTGGKLTFTLSDHHGTATTQITADAAQTVTRRKTTIFGGTRGTQPSGWTGDKGFVGGTDDTATGLVHLGAREYDAALGRFVSVDPLFVTDDPRQHNAYTYSNNNPVSLSDPAGTEIGSPPNSCLYDLKNCSKKEQDAVGYDPDTGTVTPPSGGGGGGGGGGSAKPPARHYCDGCVPLLPKLPKGVVVPDGGMDVLWSNTTVTYYAPWTDYSTGANVRTVAKDQTLAFTYTYAAMYAAMEQFADKWGWSASVKAGGKAGIPLVAEGSVEATLGLNGDYTWTNADTRTNTATAAEASTMTLKKGERFGYVPSGYVTQYSTVYQHKDGRTSTKNWGTFDVHTWQGNTFTEQPQNLIKLDVIMCTQMGTCGR